MADDSPPEEEGGGFLGFLNIKFPPSESTIFYGVFILVLAISAPLLRRVPRSRGKNIFFQIIFFAAAFAAVFLVPPFIQDRLFSPVGVLAIGTIVPVYESIVAACSVGEEDDTAWLQFWISNAMLSYTTEFMDEITSVLPNAGEHWYEFEFFVTLWLMNPFTDGAAFIYDHFTKPFIAPMAQKMTKTMEGWGGVLMTIINSSYLWLVWFTFMSLPEEARRFIVVAVGTVYPIAASTVAITTETTGLDDTYWLVYWSCFSLLFILMDYLENWVGGIRGFYSICLVATVWLFLPMFQGARSVFRNVLVPLSGQYENMLLHDAYLVKMDAEKKIPENLHSKVFPKFANVFQKGKTD